MPHVDQAPEFLAKRRTLVLTPTLAEVGHTFLLFLIFDQNLTPHFDFFKVVDLEISCLGSPSLIPELEYVSSYGPGTFRQIFQKTSLGPPQYSGETRVFG